VPEPCHAVVATPSDPDSRIGALADLAAALACVVLALAVHRPALGSYFSPDDLILLERARGFAPEIPSLWRFLSGHAWFAIAVPAFGSDPRPYLTIHWLLHGLNVALLYAWVRQAGGGRPTAFLAAGLFGSSRLFFTVVAQASGIGDLLALTFTLTACLVLSGRGVGVRAIAIAAFACALLSKESVALIPLALLLVPAIAPTVSGRLRRVAPLFVLSVGWIAYLLATKARSTVLGGPAYEAELGTHVTRNLASYAAWMIDLRSITPDTPANLADARVGAAVILVMLISAMASRRRTRLPWAGLTWWVVGLAPVLPLLWQRHAHYLYAPSVGFAMAIGAALEVLLLALTRSMVGARRTVAIGSVAVLLVVGHSVLSSALVRARVSRVLALPDVEIPEDPFVRKVELVRRVSRGVAGALPDGPVRIVFYAPKVEGSTDYFSNLLPSLFRGGRGLRALFPNVDSVAFVERWTPDYEEFELIAGTTDGYVVPFGRGPEAHARLVESLTQNGYEALAREHLDAVGEVYPDDPRLHRARSMLDSVSARAALVRDK
jgi:hypothetical protein